MKRRDVLKLLFGSLASFVVPVEAPAKELNSGNVFVDLCNLAISHEYGAIVQYLNHAGIVGEGKVSDVLLSNLQDELYLARKLTEILVREGATPTVSVWSPQTGKGVMKLLQEDLNGERAAVRLYSKLLDLPESVRFRDLINSFKVKEEIHESRLVELINAYKK